MMTRLWLAGAGLVAALSTGPALAWGPGGGMWDYGRGGWGGMAGGLPMLIFWAVIIFLVVLSARWFDGRRMVHQPAGRQTPLEILQERFARGEIDESEYTERRKALGH